MGKQDRDRSSKVVLRRCAIERASGRMAHLVSDQERDLAVSEAMIHVAMGALLTRIAHPV